MWQQEIADVRGGRSEVAVFGVRHKMCYNGGNGLRKKWRLADEG